MADVTTETLSQAAPDPTVDSLQQFLDGIAKTPLLTAAEELDLARRIERGDLDAKDHMTRANLRLVVEPGGAAALAAALAGKVDADGRTAIVLSGGNVDPGVFAQVLTET